MIEDKDSAESSRGRSRRDWLKTVVRYCTMAVLIGGVGELVLRTERPLPTGGTCRKSRCKTCRLVARCDLPQARDWRAAPKQGGTS